MDQVFHHWHGFSRQRGFALSAGLALAAMARRMQPGMRLWRGAARSIDTNGD